MAAVYTNMQQHERSWIVSKSSATIVSSGVAGMKDLLGVCKSKDGKDIRLPTTRANEMI